MAQRVRKIQELLSWVNELLGLQYSDIVDLSNGVAFVQILHSLYRIPGTLSRVKWGADSRHSSEHNFKILQQMFQSDGVGVDKEFALNEILNRNRLELYHLLTWVREHYRDTLKKRGVESIAYDAVAEREKIRARRQRGVGGDNVSDTSGSLCSSNTLGSRSSSNYTSSYNARHRVTKFGRLYSYQTSTRSSRNKSVFPPTPAEGAPCPTALVQQALPCEEDAALGCVAAGLCVAVASAALATSTACDSRTDRVVSTPSSVQRSKSPEAAACGDNDGKVKRRTAKFRGKNKSAGRVSRILTRRQNMDYNDYVPAQGLLPMGFNFIDPTTWSGDTVCPLRAVAEWQEDIEDSVIMSSPSHTQSPPQTPASAARSSQSGVMINQSADHSTEAYSQGPDVHEIGEDAWVPHHLLLSEPATRQDASVQG